MTGAKTEGSELERRLLRHLDVTLIGIVMVIMIYGLVAIESATRSYGWTGDISPFVRQQIVAIVVSLAAMAVVALIDYDRLVRASTVVYLLNIALLAAVMLRGAEGGGAQRWLELGFLRLQPSELAKVFVVLTLASQLSACEREWPGPVGYVRAFLHVGPPMALIFLQPDLGTSIVLVAVVFGMLFMSGAPTIQVLAMAGGGLMAVVAAIRLHLVHGLWLPLKPYQLMRLIVFTNPDIDPLGSGYHLRQSLIAVGSGRLWGKGLFAGAQNQLNFLPAQHTDFIFSVVAEELGFVGAGFLLFLYLVLIIKAIQIAAHSRNAVGTLIASGVASMFVFQIVVNIGMTTGIMPITGIPLPFMSCGGSSMLAGCIAVGLLLNVSMRRHKSMF